MNKNNQTTAIYYKPDGYSTQTKRLLGRQSAGEGFLKAYIQSNEQETLYCHSSNDEEFNHFRQLVTPWLKKPCNFRLISTAQPDKLEQVSNLYIPGPSLTDFAWQRRFYDQRGYSICGVTHTIASKEAISSIGDLLTAPIQPWDALICTSNAVKIAVEKILNDWGEYLGERLNSSINLDLKLPVIPLGVETDKFQHNPEFRNNIRQRFNIAPEDIVILFVGRLIFYAKGHPVPMYLALEKAAKKVNHQHKIHLIQCGWFEDDREASSFQESAVKFSPSINHLFLDGRNPEIRQQIWSSADIFISLADNIQETFGLTPIEAMAAGLPVIVSDWNGYKESVRNEIDGFRISTVIPSENNALDLASYYLSDYMNYSTYIGHASLSTMIDIDECATAFVKLIDDFDLRTKMGENGKQRAQDIYDWQNVIKSYRELWQELGEIRNIKAMSVPVKKGSPFHPLCDDPFNLFSHYTTEYLTPETNLKLGSMCEHNSLEIIRNIWVTNFGSNYRLSNDIIDKIILDLKNNQSLNVAYFISIYGRENQHLLIRTLLYLLKFDILKMNN